MGNKRVGEEKENTGFELDKIDLSSLSKTSSGGTEGAVTTTEPSPSVSPEQEETGLPESAKTEISLTEPSARRSRRMKFVIGGLCVLTVVCAAVFLMLKMKINTSRMPPKPVYYAKPDTYISIGPVISSLKSGDTVKITLDINCVTTQNRQTVADLEGEIRNRVTWTLQTSEAEKLLKEADYISLRLLLSKRVMAIIPENTVTEIYFSEFLRY